MRQPVRCDGRVMAGRNWLIAMLALLVVPQVLLSATPAQRDLQEAMARAPDAERGARGYLSCRGCHQADGFGNEDGSVPRIAGQHRGVIVKLLTDYRHAVRWDPRMQYYADTHMLADMQAIADVAAYISGLEPRTRIGHGDGNRLPLGRALYAARCASCHGESGEGDAEALIPAIAGQHYAYLLRQFRDALEGRRPALSAAHATLFEELAGSGPEAVADALSRAAVGITPKP